MFWIWFAGTLFVLWLIGIGTDYTGPIDSAYILLFASIGIFAAAVDSWWKGRQITQEARAPKKT